jgi:repressor of nif and glnA expression
VAWAEVTVGDFNRNPQKTLGLLPVFIFCCTVEYNMVLVHSGVPRERVHMVQGATSETERKIISILKVLSESSEPLGSITIARELERHGIFLSERAVRYHLRITDERGYTQPLGRDGRMLTPQGLEELRMALAPEQVGFVEEKLELLAFHTTFDPQKRTGQIPINTSLIDKDKFKKALSAMSDVFKVGMCVSDLVAIASEGERLGSVVIPSGKTGLATVCSVVVNGVLLKAGVPVDSRFGGVLEVQNSKPRRFVAIINYSGTSLDPSEQYIRARMTSVSAAAKTGNGKILANFREIPSPSRAIVEEKIALLKDAGIKGVYVLGNTSEPVCQIAVGMNRVGMVLLGGLNPVAAAFEAGIEVENIGESGLIDFERLISFWQL